MILATTTQVRGARLNVTRAADFTDQEAAAHIGAMVVIINAVTRAGMDGDGPSAEHLLALADTASHLQQVVIAVRRRRTYMAQAQIRAAVGLGAEAVRDAIHFLGLVQGSPQFKLDARLPS